MSTPAEIISVTRIPEDLLKQHGPALDAWFDERFIKKMKKLEESKTPSSCAYCN